MDLRYKKLVCFLGVAILFGFCLPALALELEWPVIAGSALKEGASMADVTKYFFSLATALGGVAMVFVALSAGLGLFFGHGEPAKFQAAKNKLLGSAIGMGLLLSIYVIISTINADILKKRPVDIPCVQGIERTIKATYIDEKTEKQKERIYSQCINTDQPDLALKSGEELVGEEKVSFDDCVLREVVAYSEKDYKGYKTVLFKDDTTNNESCPKANNFKLGNAKAVRFSFKKDGVYLYDNGVINKEGDSSPSGERTVVELLSPYYLRDSVSNFNEKQINDKIDKIEFVSTDYIDSGAPKDYLYPPGNKSRGNFYGSVVFSELNYRGKCLYASYFSYDLNKKDLATGEDLDLRDDISSVIAFKAPYHQNQDPGMGKVTLYAVPNCQDVDSPDRSDKGRYDKCSVNIDRGSEGWSHFEKYISAFEARDAVCAAETFLTPTAYDRKKEIKKNGGKMTKEDVEYYPIQSFKIEGSAGVVIKSDAGNCHYFNLKESERRGNCITNLQDVFKNWSGGEKPKTIMIFPLDY